MKYKIFFLSVYDEYIEEENAAGCYLTKEHAEKVLSEGRWDSDYQPGSIWISGSSDWNIDHILSEVWVKEDVDLFAKLYPETSSYEYKILKETMRGRNWEYYCPLQQKREKNVLSILS